MPRQSLFLAKSHSPSVATLIETLTPLVIILSSLEKRNKQQHTFLSAFSTSTQTIFFRNNRRLRYKTPWLILFRVESLSFRDQIFSTPMVLRNRIDPIKPPPSLFHNSTYGKQDQRERTNGNNIQEYQQKTTEYSSENHSAVTWFAFFYAQLTGHTVA